MSDIPRLVGMVHLLPLPGAPRYGGSMDEVVTTAVDDATLLAAAGFPALMVENFGDVPFFASSVPPETVASMSIVVEAVSKAVGLSLGVNVLRNDGLAALAIAAATGGRFIRVNVLSGMMHTDQGPIVGNAAEIARRRLALCPGTEVWADVLVKHASPPPGAKPAEIARDTLERGGADALIVSGSGTGEEPDYRLLGEIRSAVPEATRLVIGSGATARNLEELMRHADTVIVGSAIKVHGSAINRVDEDRAKEFAAEASRIGVLRR